MKDNKIIRWNKSHHIKGGQGKWTEGKRPKTKNRGGPFFPTLRGPIKTLNWALYYIHRGPGAVPCRSVLAASISVSSYPGPCSPGVLHLFWVPPLLRGSLSSKGRDMMETSHLDLCIPRSLFLYNVWHWISIFVLICWGSKSLWWWLNKAQIIADSKLSLGALFTVIIF